MNASALPLEAFRLLVNYRERLWEGLWQDLRQRYAGSLFGSAWAILFPALQLGIYALLYTVIFKVRPPGLPVFGYVLLVFSGLVPLMAFNEALTATTGSLSSNRALLLNTVFPAELIPVRAALAAQVPGVIGLTITLIASLLLGNATWTVLLLPLLWLLLMMFTVGIGWMLSLITLVARDIQHGLGLVTMLLFLLSPFAYTPEMVPQALKPFLALNPLSSFVLCFQRVLCYGELPQALPFLTIVLLAFTCFFGGFALFQRLKAIFFDYA